jgi:hypothetical protein
MCFPYFKLTGIELMWRQVKGTLPLAVNNRKSVNKMNTPEHKIAVTVRYLGPTNFRESRVALNLPRWDARKVVAWNYENVAWNYENDTDSSKQALAWFESQSITPDTYLELPECYVFAFPWSQLDAVLKAFGVEVAK